MLGIQAWKENEYVLVSRIVSSPSFAASFRPSIASSQSFSTYPPAYGACLSHTLNLGNINPSAFFVAWVRSTRFLCLLPWGIILLEVFLAMRTTPCTLGSSGGDVIEVGLEFFSSVVMALAIFPDS